MENRNKKLRFKADVSVIMPIYNGEKYLEETLDSLLKQTYKNFEIICIDDTSTDTTPYILKRFQELDGRIRIIRNGERAGAAFSRNKGIQAAVGKYITFLDGDDIFDEDMLRTARNAMIKYDLDLVMYEYKTVPCEHIYEKQSVFRNDRFIEKYCRTPFSVCECEPIEFLNWSDSPSNKLYRKEFIVNNHLEFQSLPSSNDVYFVNMALLLAKKILMLSDRRVMVYARDHNVSTRISNNRDPMCAYKAMEKIGNELVKREIFPMVFQHYYHKLFYALIFAVRKTKNEENARYFYDFLQREGVDRLMRLASDRSNKINQYIYQLSVNFKKADYFTRWYWYENVLAYYLNKNFQKVISLFQSYENCGMRTALWGVGINGGVFLRFLQSHGLKVSELIDKDEKKWGKRIGGYEIKKPKEVLGKVDIVLVCTDSLYQTVKEELRGMEIEVVCVDQILQEG